MTPLASSHFTQTQNSAAPPQRWRHVRTLLFVHIAASVALVGGDLAILILGASGKSGAKPETIYPAMERIATWGLQPLALLALVSGVALGLAGPFGLVRYWWVTIKLAVTVVLTTLVITVVVPGLGRAADTAEGIGTSTLLSEAQMLMYVVIPSTALGLLLLNVALAVFKPSWRVHRDDGRHSTVDEVITDQTPGAAGR